MDKIRLRSDEELDRQNRGLQELKRVFEGVGGVYYLASGTLLGAVRENHFIRWDWDVQLYIKTEEYYHRVKELLHAFEGAGFRVVRYDPSFRSFKFNLLKYDTTYEITGWWRKGDMRYRARCSQVPARFFEEPQAIMFLGERYPCMTPPEQYLEHCYGNWRTPRREADKDKYLAPSFYRYPLWYRRVVRMLHRSAVWLLRRWTSDISA